MSEQAVKTAMCYRADKSLKWATWLPGKEGLPSGITIEEGETLWPCVYYGREDSTFGEDGIEVPGRTFFVPAIAPIKGPAVTDTTVNEYGLKR